VYFHLMAWVGLSNPYTPASSEAACSACGLAATSAPPLEALTPGDTVPLGMLELNALPEDPFFARDAFVPLPEVRVGCQLRG